MSSKKQIRKSPIESATIFEVGTIKKEYVITETSNGVKRWTPMVNAKLNNMQLLTVDYLVKNIDKTVKLYVREYDNKFPSKSDWNKKNPTYQIMKFKPTGNAIIGKKILVNWLKIQKPEIKDNSMFFIEGYLDSHLSSLQVDSKNKKVVSVNLMNSEVFVESK